MLSLLCYQTSVWVPHQLCDLAPFSLTPLAITGSMCTFQWSQACEYLVTVFWLHFFCHRNVWEVISLLTVSMCLKLRQLVVGGSFQGWRWSPVLFWFSLCGFFPHLDILLPFLLEGNSMGYRTNELFIKFHNLQSGLDSAEY